MSQLQAMIRREDFRAILSSHSAAQRQSWLSQFRWRQEWCRCYLHKIRKIAMIEGVSSACAPVYLDDEPYIRATTGLYSVDELAYKKGLPTLRDIDSRAESVRGTWDAADIQKRTLRLGALRKLCGIQFY